MDGDTESTSSWRVIPHMAKLTVTDDLLTAALAGYEAELDRIEGKMGEVRRMLGDRPNDGAALSDGTRPKRRFSAASRRKMAAAQKARWAGTKKSSEPPQVAQPKKKRKMSAAGRKAISEATKKRWAAVKAKKAAA